MEWICFCFYTVFISSKQEVITVMSLLEAKGIRKIYKTRFGGAVVEALKNVNFSVEKGEYVAIMGESGSGKTTLLNIIAALDKPTEGTVTGILNIFIRRRIFNTLVKRHRYGRSEI